MIIYPNKPFDGLYEGKDVEAELEDYMTKLMEYTDGNPFHYRETRVHEKVKIPDGYNIPLRGPEWERLPVATQRKISSFWEEQDKYIREGKDGLSPMEYLYFNFFNLHGGKGELKYRRNDNEFFWLVDACIEGDNDCFQGYHKKGILALGRRRSGKSSKVGCIVNHQLRTKKDANYVLTSKNEDDANMIIEEKVAFQFDSQPVAIKPDVLRRSGGVLHLGSRAKDAAGNPIVKGRNMKVLSKATKPTSIESGTLIGWIHDEAPKTKKFLPMFRRAIEALNDEEGLTREGFFLGIGVAGDFDVHGKDFIQIWKSAHSYGLVRWFIAGWAGVNIDEKGNEDIRGAVRRILQRRNDVWSNGELSPGEREIAMIELMQKFPLTVEEGLQGASSASKFDDKKMKMQVDALSDFEEGVPIFSGKMRWDIPMKSSYFEPASMNFNVQMLEPPKANAHYVIGGDVYGLKQQDVETGSGGCAWVFKLKNRLLNDIDTAHLYEKIIATDKMEEKLKLFLELGHMPVALYADRYFNPEDMARDMLALSLYYQRGSGVEENAKMLVETTPPIVINWLMTNCRDRLLPSPIMPGKRPPKTLGVDMKGYWAEQRLGVIAHYIATYCNQMFFKSFLTKAPNYDETDPNKKYDEIDGFGVTLIAASDPRIQKWNAMKIKEEENEDAPLFGFRRNRRPSFHENSGNLV